MQLNRSDLETIAAFVRHEAKLHELEIVTAFRVAERLFGRGAVRVIPHLSVSGAIATIQHETRIFLREGIPDPNHTTSHELGHWGQDVTGIPRGPDTEAYADYIGAAIIVPPKALQAAYQAVGFNLSALANTFRCTQSLIALRCGEVLGHDLALVARQTVRTRQTSFPWPDPPTVRSWAKGRPPKGLAKVRLTGDYDRGRVLLRAS